VERAVRRRRQVDRHVEGADDAVVAVGEQVLDVVERAEDEDVVAVPRAALDADGLVRHAQLLELARRDHDPVLREERDARLVVTPDDVLEGARHVQLGHRLPLLHVEERDALLRPQQQAAGARRVDRVGARVRRLHLLRHLVLEVLDQDLLVLVEHSEALARDEDGGGAEPALALGAARLGAAAVLRHLVQLVRASLGVEVDQQHRLLLVVVDGARDGVEAARAADRHQRRVLR